MKYMARVTHVRGHQTVIADCTVVETDEVLQQDEYPFYYEIESPAENERHTRKASDKVASLD